MIVARDGFLSLWKNVLARCLGRNGESRARREIERIRVGRRARGLKSAREFVSARRMYLLIRFRACLRVCAHALISYEADKRRAIVFFSLPSKEEVFLLVQYREGKILSDFGCDAYSLLLTYDTRSSSLFM